MKTASVGRETETEPASPFEELLEAVAAATENGASPQPASSLVQTSLPAPENGQAQPVVKTDNPASAGEAPPAPAITPADPVIVVIAATAATVETIAAANTKCDAKPDESPSKDKSPDKAKTDDSGAALDPSAIVDVPTAKPDAVATVPVTACVTDAPPIARPDAVAITVEAPQLVQPVPLAPPKAVATKAAPATETPQRKAAPPAIESEIPTADPAPGVLPKTAAKADTTPHDGPAPETRRPAATDVPAFAASPTLPATHKDVAAAKTAPDAPQPISLSVPSPQTDAPAQISAPVTMPPPTAAAVPLAGVPIAIVGKALEGKNRFEIRLDPPDLGRIEVRLDVGHDGSVTSHIVADRSDTLNLLRNDAPALQRALENAGLRAGDNGLQFSLRDQGANQQQQQQQQTNASSVLIADDVAPPAFDPAMQNYGRFIARAGGVDIRV